MAFSFRFQFQCEDCDFSSPDAKALSSHIREKHICDKRYRCDMCDFATFDKQSLLVHLESGRCLPDDAAAGDDSQDKSWTSKALHCELCNSFEARSPFDIIDHLREFHVSKAKIPIVRLERIK